MAKEVDSSGPQTKRRHSLSILAATSHPWRTKLKLQSSVAHFKPSGAARGERFTVLESAGAEHFRRCRKFHGTECSRRQSVPLLTPDLSLAREPSPLSGQLLLNLPKGSKETLSAPLRNAEDGKDEGLALVRRQTGTRKRSTTRGPAAAAVLTWRGRGRGSPSGGTLLPRGGAAWGLRTGGAFPNTGLGFLPVKNGEFHC
uniref:Uncharacterized protein n=1 Tax=Rangifer tarandus platyrhynchus TaxID=3082113 RepID=A0ACB0F3T5_RANTA|nr:unnamed protein product [Rangifer tarandus platyrhynchus]